MNNSDKPPTVFVVDDDEALRDSIHWLLDSVKLKSKMFPNASDFVASCDPGAHGCLLLDIRMPGMSGMELLEVLRYSGISLPVIIITGHGDVPMAVRALKHGAFDFIQKPFNAQDLLDRVNAALELDRSNRERSNEIERRRASFAILTDRETEVVDMLMTGASSKAIAQKLKISPKTVDIHRANIMRKLNVRSVVEIVQLKLDLQDS